ncbi:putative hGE-14 protein [Anaplasma phagocytophilum str. NCH-1]|nr:hypothetical protein [Anaplasma phagocytophilum]KJV66165.1 putative hGE-14 protein [Anaplasma phagocytophilum str. NCH-1]
MSGYAYSGLSSKEYRDETCAAITSSKMTYAACLTAVHECMLELRSTFDEIRGLDSAFEENARRIESIERDLIERDLAAESVSSAGATAQERVLCELAYNLCDTLYGCATASCNRNVVLFMDPGFIGRGAHLQIAKVCGILVNSIAIVNCCIRDLVARSVSVAGARDDSSTFRAALALSTHVNAQFSALSRCLNYSPGPEETKRRKAILRVVRHNIELCNKVAELFGNDTLHSIRVCTERSLKRILNAMEATSAKCEEMVSDDESAQRHLAIAKKAKTGLVHHLRGHDVEARPATKYCKLEGYVGALVHSIGALFLMYRGYASTGNTEHASAAIIEHCLKILLTLPSTRRSLASYKVRKMYVDMRSVYGYLEQHLGADLLLNPGAEVKLRDAALRYLSEMMEICEREYGKYCNVVEQTGGSPSQPSTSGLGGTAGLGHQQASHHMPSQDSGIMPHAYAQPSTSYAQPSTSWDQPSTSGLGGTAGLGHQQASHHMPSQDSGIMPHAYAQPSTSYAQPSTSWDQPSTSGLGGTAGLGHQQASHHMPSQDSGIMPHAYAQPSTSYAQPSTSWDQPSTSGLGGTAGQGAQLVPPPPHILLRVLENVPYPSSQFSTSGLGGTSTGMGRSQAPYVPPQDQGIMPYSWDQPSASGLGGASSTLEEAQVSTHRSQTPDDDEDEQPSKRARYR